LDALLTEEELPTWSFGIEKKTYKDTITIMNSTNKEDRQARTTVSRRDFDKTFKFKDSVRSHQEPLLNIEVNIDDNNRVEKLEIYPNDDPIRVANSFSKKYGKFIFK
jgi:hypothetical protein